MIERLLRISIRFRWAVVLLTALVAVYGFNQLLKVPIDAVPDITNKQVQINTVAPALGPLDMERLVTFPVETAMAGIPGLESTRSISRNGFSQVTAIFEDDTDLYFARQQVAERLTGASENLPAGVEPRMGPVTTGLGEVFMYVVEYAPAGTRDVPRIAGQPGPQPDGSYLTPEGERLTDDTAKLAYLRTVQDWILRPQLTSVEGIAGIDSIGGYEKQYVVEPDPSRMATLGISLTELAEALERANVSVGANFFERGGEAFLVRADGRIRTLDEIARAAVTTRSGVPIVVRDIANVRIGGDLRTGAASEDGQEVVVGTALMRAGGNSRTVAASVGTRLEELTRSLPPGIVVHPVLDRSKLVDATISTVEENLLIGALLVIAILFWLLGNIRAAIIATLVIPLSFLVMAIGMNATGTSGNLMSLGALDFGLIVDGSIIIIENALRRLAQRQHSEGRLFTLPERLEEVFQASREMIRPTIYGQAIIFLVFAPLLTFTGVEGKMFSPMAITVMLALAGAFILSLTFVPAMVALLIRGKVDEKEVPAIAWTKRRYAPLLDRALMRPWPVIGVGVGIFAAAALLFTQLGREFIPQLDEGDIAILSARVPSTSLDQSLEFQRRIERAVASLPEVEHMFAKTGTAEAALDPMPQNISDSFIILKPKVQWPAGVDSKEDVIARVEAKLEPLVGNAYEMSQPIELRFNELIAGVRSDVAVKIYGDDLDELGRVGQQVAGVLRTVPGAADVKVEQTEGFPTLDVQFDRDAIARYGLTLREVSDTVAAALGGREAGIVFEGDRRFNVVVRMPNTARNDLEAIGALPVIVENGGNGFAVPLRQLARFSLSDGLNQVSRENGKRRAIVQANVRGSDLGSFVTGAREKITGQVQLPAGTFLEWGGQYENLQDASRRLTLVVPAVFALIFLLLYLALGKVRPALAIYSAIPLALAGGVFALAIAGLPFSISAAVGFIALSGIAVLNGLVLMSSVEDRRNAGMPLEEAIRDSALTRLRPVLMTALVASLGFVPMALATGQGSEVQRPLAIVVIGGLITSTVLTLLVLPAVAKMLMRVSQRKASTSTAAKVVSSTPQPKGAPA